MANCDDITAPAMTRRDGNQCDVFTALEFIHIYQFRGIYLEEIHRCYLNPMLIYSENKKYIFRNFSHTHRSLHINKTGCYWWSLYWGIRMYAKEQLCLCRRESNSALNLCKTHVWMPANLASVYRTRNRIVEWKIVIFLEIPGGIASGITGRILLIEGGGLE